MLATTPDDEELPVVIATWRPDRRQPVHWVTVQELVVGARIVIDDQEAMAKVLLLGGFETPADAVAFYEANAADLHLLLARIS